MRYRAVELRAYGRWEVLVDPGGPGRERGEGGRARGAEGRCRLIRSMWPSSVTFPPKSKSPSSFRFSVSY
ncbi:MAG: hypothetical protein ACKESB_02835 [Candidatus Hodgkinia cicadicola]